MQTYSFLREMADSWFLLLMTLFFVGAILWALRPGAKPLQHDAAASIFRNDTKPAGERGRGAEADRAIPSGQKEA
ncbi:MAG: cbb3-type cytochrome c oxidase subunit 3 [Rhodobacteraceae bacterium]|nr:cbb3-type cytochrome c oxidase subunit 3 [Paracoccaceae bacterium]